MKDNMLMSRLFRFVCVVTCACSLSACSETEYVSHLLKRSTGSSSYADTTPTYSNNPSISGNRQQENGFKVGNPYQAMGQWYTPSESYSYDETGIASWYGPGFHGKRTANGEPYDSYDMTAAHPTLQLPCIARVTNLENGRSVVVRVNDRGPFKRSRLMDVSKRAAELLGMIGTGTAKVRVQVLDRESRIVANAARQGVSPSAQMAMALRGSATSPEDQQNTATQIVAAQNDNNMNDAGTMTQVSSGVAMPAAQIAQTDLNDYQNHTVRKFPVQKTSLFIQVGSFGDARNAAALAGKLTALGQTRLAPATVNGRVFSRVQIGPVASVDDADRLLSKTIKAGYSAARIVVE